LLVHTELEHTTSKLRQIFENLGFDVRSSEDSMLRMPFSVEQLESITDPIRHELSVSEREETRVVLVEGDEEPKTAELIGAKSLQDVLGQLSGRWLIDIIQEKRLFTTFQPIVRAEQPSDIFGYECLLRGEDREGNTVNPGRIFQTAEEADLVYQLDRRARVLSVDNSQSYDIEPDQKIFINFLPTSIYDPEYCLNTTMKAVQKADAVPEQFVFEVVESEQVEDRDKLVDIMSYYREKGFQVALDDFGAGYSSLQMLSDMTPDVLKLDMGLVQNISENKMKAELCEQILNISANHDITTLAEGIETREQLEWFQARNLDLAQGFLFSKPSVPPPECVDYS